MSERKDEKWLDEQLQRVVNGRTPAFDAEAWKRKYAGEFQTLLGRSGQPSRPGAGRTLRFVQRASLGRWALAAAILVGAGVLLVGRFGAAPDGSTPALQPRARQSPAQMVSMISLSAAFRQGGIDELNKQCDRALKTLGPRPNSVSIQDLLKDINDKG